jgi:hypothetical protein
MLMLRLQQLRVSDDLLSKPLARLAEEEAADPPSDEPIQPSDQARMIELLQILLYLRGKGASSAESVG